MSTADIVEIVIDCICVLGAIIAIITGIVNAHRVHDVHDEVIVDENIEEEDLHKIIELQQSIIDKLIDKRGDE